MKKTISNEPDESDLDENGFNDYLKVGTPNIKYMTADVRAGGNMLIFIDGSDGDYEIPDIKTTRFVEVMKTEFCYMLSEQSSIQGWKLTRRQCTLFGHEMAKYYSDLVKIEYIDRDKMMDILYKIMNNKGYPIFIPSGSRKPNNRKRNK